MVGSMYVVCLGTFVEAGVLVFGLTASKPEHRWDQGILGKYRQLHPWEESWPAQGSVEAADTIFASEMVSDFDSLHKPVTLDESQPGSSGCY